MAVEFAKYYTVWIEIEEHDTDPEAVEEYTDMSDGLMFTGEVFETLKEAENFAHFLKDIGEGVGRQEKA